MRLKRFRAPAWAWMVTVAAVVVFAALGTWQMNRGFAKQAWLAQYRDASGPALRVARGTAAPPESDVRRAEVSGEYLAARQLLADGQSHAQRPGYHVWTPLRLTDGGLVLVNRGWIPQPADLDDLPEVPAPAGPVTLRGWYRSLPSPGWRVGDDVCAAPQRFPAVVLYPGAEQLACLLGEDVVPGLFLLGPAEPGGFVREWSPGGLPPERHFGYAVQWYALGVTAVVLFVLLSRRSAA